MRVGHSVNECKNKHTCKTCSKKHHSLIQTAQGTYCALKLKTNRNILLSTALCKTLDNSGKPRLCRILLDSGSQANFITPVSYTHLDVYKRQVCVERKKNYSLWFGCKSFPILLKLIHEPRPLLFLLLYPLYEYNKIIPIVRFQHIRVHCYLHNTTLLLL